MVQEEDIVYKSTSVLSDEDTFTLLSDNLATENTQETFETPCEVPFCFVSMKLGHWQKNKQI